MEAQPCRTDGSISPRLFNLQRGATIVNATGAFTGDDKYIILTVLSPSQAVKLRNFIKEHDPKAFLLISNTSEIIGKGFHSV